MRRAQIICRTDHRGTMGIGRAVQVDPRLNSGVSSWTLQLGSFWGSKWGVYCKDSIVRLETYDGQIYRSGFTALGFSASSYI